LRADLAVLNDELPTEFELPLDPNIKLGRLKIAKCKYMDSKKLPLWLVFQNADPQVALSLGRVVALYDPRIRFIPDSLT
jgi:hypothetical protein